MELASAIENRLPVLFTYDGHFREVIPAALGYHRSTGNLLLRGYQIDGTSASRPIPFWHLFLVSKMVGIRVGISSFDENPPGYAPDDKDLWPVIRQL